MKTINLSRGARGLIQGDAGLGYWGLSPPKAHLITLTSVTSRDLVTLIPWRGSRDMLGLESLDYLDRTSASGFCFSRGLFFIGQTKTQTKPVKANSVHLLWEE